MVIGRDGDPYYLGDSGSLFASTWSASAHRNLTQDEASSIARQTFELKKLVEEFDPDNQQALRAISDILMMPTILKLNVPKMPLGIKEQPRKPNGEFDFKPR